MLKSAGKGVALTKRLVKALRSSGRGAEALDQLADVERVAIAAEKIGLKGAGELKAIAEDLGESVPSAGNLVDVLGSAKSIRSQMSNLGEVILGTQIPKFFWLKTEVAEFFW
jgi:xanthine dehydrogenase iron-sulfur cluster and FAD-binding subunit A